MYFVESDSNLKKVAKFTMLLYIMSLNYIAIAFGRVADILFIAFAVCAIIYALANGIKRQGFNRVCLFIIGILILLFVTYLRSPNKVLALSGSWTLIQLLGFDFLLLITIDERGDIKNCLLAYVGGTYTMMCFVLAQTGIHFLSVLPTWRFVEGGSEINVNSIGTAAGYTFIILLLLFKGEQKKYYIFLMILPLLFVIASASRAAMLVVVFGLIVSVLFSGTRGVGAKLLLVGGGLIIIYQMLKMYNLFPAFTGRFDQLLIVREGIENSDGSTKSRYDLLMYGLSEMRKRPLLGYGVGQFRFVVESGYLGAHNAIVQIGHAFGLIGLIFWYGNMFQAIVQILSRKREGPEYWIAILSIVQIAMLISSQPLTTKTSHMLIVLLLLSSVMVDDGILHRRTENDMLLHIQKEYLK